MTKFFLLALVLFSAPSAFADRHSEALQTCAKFRRSSIAQQRRDARPYTREQVFRACNEILRPSKGGGNYTPTRPQDRSCTGSVQCHPSQHCVNRRCEDRIRRSCSDRGLNTCPAGEECMRGTCER